MRGFREAALAGLAPPVRPSGPSPEAKEIVDLKRELRRKKKALAEAAAILVLRKKADALWGGESEDMVEKNER